MDITLNDQELDDVVDALEHRLRGIRTELVHTDHREFREGLRRDLDRMERLRNRLDTRRSRQPEL